MSVYGFEWWTLTKKHIRSVGTAHINSGAANHSLGDILC
jgi:hypothetical protein